MAAKTPTIKSQIADLKKLKQQQEEYQSMLKSNVDINKKDLKIINEKIAAIQKQRDKGKEILADDIAKLSHAKKLSEIHRTSSKIIKDTVSSQQLQKQGGVWQSENAGETKNMMEEMLLAQQDTLKHQSASQLAMYDHEQTMEQIAAWQEEINDLNTESAALVGEEAEQNKDKVDKLQTMLNTTEQIASAKEQEQATSELGNKAADDMLGMLGGSVAGLKGMIKGAKGFGLAMKAAIMGTGVGALLVVIGVVITALIAAYNVTGDLRDELGISQMEAAKLAVRMGPAAIAIKLMGEDVTKLGAAFIDTFGTIESVQGDTLIAAANLRREFGASEESIAGLSKLFTDTLGVSIKDSLGLIKDIGDTFDEAGIAAGSAINEMAENAEFLAEYMDGTVSSMTQAVIEAHKMGLELGTVSKIADGLLEFETSITKTMEASLLIGKQLNFDRARGLALEGKVNEAVQDMVGQLGGVAEFQRLNVLQRRGLAEALGVGVDELGALIRGENTVELTSDPLLDSNKQLMEAINSNTAALRGEKENKSNVDKRNAASEKQKERDLSNKQVQRQIELAEEELFALKTMKQDMHTVAGLAGK